ncbi:ABC transporter ATP-binding protein [Candidatus Parcubacteria bacterium]|nr:ABC transporter ATP-binding protein [Candidatus Parcubacteria bacterium]
MDDETTMHEIDKTWREYLVSSRKSAGVFRWVWQRLATPESRLRMKRFAAAVGVGMFLDVVQSQFIGYVITGQSVRRWEFLWLGLVGFLSCQVVGKIVDYVEAMSREWLLGHNHGLLDRRLNELFFEKSLGQHLHESSTLNPANIERGRSEVHKMHDTIMFEGLGAFASLAFSLLSLLWLSPMAGGVMSAVLIGHIVWMLFLNQRVLAEGSVLDADSRKLNRHRVERWDRIERVGTSAKQTEETAYMAGFFDDILARDRELWFWFIRQSTLRDSISLVAVAFIAGYGSSRVWRGLWPVGLLYPLFDWSLRVKNNIWRIGHIEREFHWSIPSVKAMIEALSLTPEVVDRPDAVELDPAEPISVRFEHVSHTYPVASRQELDLNGDGKGNGKASGPVLRDVSFEIGPGEKAALIGPSGAGKTSVGRLALRYMDPEGGRISVNGHALSDIKLASWLRLVGYIAQQPFVFDGTIRYNLTYALDPETRERITDGELWALMRLLKIDFGERLTDGLETVVGRHGVKLSGGEAQRLMIGAAAIKKPRFMVIDEATSSLDSTTERAVQAGLAEVLREGVSALIVAHRLSTVRSLCGKFVVLRNSSEVSNDCSQVEAVASSFEELYEISPTFRRLADDQGIVI